MKKILSIFSIGAVLGSGTIMSGGGIACGTKPTPPPSPKTFDLNSIKLGDNIVGLKQQNSAIEINGKATYSKVEKDIINQYNKVVTNNKLTSSSFVINSTTPSSKTPWAIEITNGDVKINNTTTSNLQVEYNKPLASKNNSLNVAITTTDPNVVTKTNDSDAKSVNIPLYFKKYIFSGQDANNGDAIKLPKTGDTITGINLTQSNVVDLTNDGFNLMNQNAANLVESWGTLNGENEIDVYSKIVSAINANFNTYMTHSPHIDKVATFSAANPVGDNTIAASKLKYFGADKTDKITLIQPASTQNFAYLEKIYVAIPVYDWTYLTNANYLSNNDTYVYAYLGQATSTFNLNTISLSNNVIAGLTKKAAAGTESASITINGGTTYSNIITQIIAQYKRVFPNSELDSSKFLINSTSPTTEKPWAIEITNGDVKVDNSATSDLKVHYDKPLANGNNSLSVTIKTTDPNVVVNSNNKKTNTIKTATINAYFHKYIFTTQDANNDDAIKLPTTGDTISGIDLTQSAVVDLSETFNFNALSVNNLVTQWNEFSGTKETNIYNKIVNAVNAKFDTYMSHSPHIDKVSTFSTTKQVGENKINASEIKIFEADSDGKITVFNDHASDFFGAGQNLYFAIPVSNWSYLTHANYFSNSDTYVFAKLGTATSKFDLNSVNIPGSVIADLNNQPRISDQLASIKINGAQTYINVANQIIDSYNEHFGAAPDQMLSINNFNFDTNVLGAQKTWAIKISNGDISVGNDIISDLRVLYNKPLASGSNSLSVTITTNDPNVAVTNNNKKTNTNKTFNTNIYFNEYIFTAQDANNNHAINVPDNSRTLTQMGLNQNYALNFSGDFVGLVRTGEKQLIGWKNVWNDLATETSQEKAVLAYNKILNNVNAKFDTYMAHVTSVSKVNDFTSTTIANNEINANKLIFFGANSAGSVEIITNDNPFKAGQQVFIAIPVFDWGYLTSANYFANSDTYVYAYLGTLPSQ